MNDIMIFDDDHRVINQNKLLSRPQGHSSFVTHLDWSRDSQYLVTNSGDYEILFCRSYRLSLFTYM